MAEKKEVKMNELFEIKSVDQKQKLLNLDTGNEDEITVTTKFIAWKGDPKPEQKIQVLRDLVTPLDKRIAMLEAGFRSASYQESKNAALASGVYATQGIKSAITTYLGGFKSYEDMKASDIWKSWLTKYQDKDPAVNAKAKKVLDLVRATQEVEDPLA